MAPHHAAPLPQLRAFGYPYECMRDYQQGYLGLSAAQAERTFNSGVLVIDMARYAARLQEVLEELMARDYAYADQDILNVAFADDHLLLPEGWNVFAGSAKPPSPYEQWYARHGSLPMVLHFAGMRNPCDNPRVDLSVCQEYWRVMAATPFFAPALQRWVRACVSEQLRQLLPPGGAPQGAMPSAPAAPAVSPSRAQRRRK